LGDPNIHFVFILASGCSIRNWPTPPNGIPTNVFQTHRGNHGMDICGWNEIMREATILGITGRPLSSYRYFVWMNASVRGPFLPSGTGAPLGRRDQVAVGGDWLDYFLIQITDRDKLIGTAINCRPEQILSVEEAAAKGGPRFEQIHLQSMFLAFDHVALPTMLEHVPCGNRITAIWGGEVRSLLPLLFLILHHCHFTNALGFCVIMTYALR
jgi:hypothetical protein